MSVQGNSWLTKLEEAFQDELFLYLVMEYFPGGDLSTLDLDGNGLEESQVRFYAAEIVMALCELHDLGYAHRDVKPGNVMIREDGHVKLTDFGSAGKFDGNGKVWSKSSVGTPDYVSPEALLAQESRKGASYGVECDWWGLGVLIYEMLVGEPPFFAPSLVQTYSNISNHQKHLKLKSNTRLSPQAVSLLEGLLCDASSRLSADKIKSHPFFAGIDWECMKLASPPFIPLLTSPEDTSRFYLDEDDEDVALNASLKKTKTAFEGVQLPFVGWTHNPQRSYQVAWDRAPALQRIASCQLRMAELEAQVEDMRVSCETAKMVGQQIRRITSSDRMGSSHDSLPLASMPPADEIQAAYDALLQNYEFIQTHYEDLLMEHTNTSRQLEALIVTLQEQEETQKTLEAQLEEAKAKASLDKVKIQELVNKLTSLATIKPTDKQLPPSKEKQLLKQKTAEFKTLQQQLRQEETARSHLEQQLAEMTRAKQALEREHEALVIEVKHGKIERRPSDAGSGLLRSIISRGHVRQASSVSTMACQAMEGMVKMLNLEASRKTLAWKKVFLSIKETGLWFGDDPDHILHILINLDCESFWARPLQPGEITGLSSKQLRHCFKIAFIKEADAQKTTKTLKSSDVASELEQVESKLTKERKMLKGAQQLFDAARTSEQQAIAQSHVDAAQRMVSDLEAVCANIRNKLESAQGDTIEVDSMTDDHAFEQDQHSGYCDGCQKELSHQSLKCTGCKTVCHRECRALIHFGCTEADRLTRLVPIYFSVNSSEEARHWIRSLNHAFK